MLEELVCMQQRSPRISRLTYDKRIYQKRKQTVISMNVNGTGAYEEQYQESTFHDQL